jgi:hypothetical protein
MGKVVVNSILRKWGDRPLLDGGTTMSAVVRCNERSPLWGSGSFGGTILTKLRGFGGQPLVVVTI